MGALAAVELRFDGVGVIALAMITGLGGGIIRDVLLDQVPIALHQDAYFAAALGAAGAGFFFAPLARRLTFTVTVIDAATLGIYGVVGTQKAMANGLDFVPATFVGLVAAVGGGVLRDVCTAQPPMIFRRGNLYASASLLGLLAFGLLNDAHVHLGPSVAVSVGITFALRLLAVRFDWRAPAPVDAPSAITRTVRRRREPPPDA
jgi:uncharacterized membrane protein YeiH